MFIDIEKTCAKVLRHTFRNMWILKVCQWLALIRDMYDRAKIRIGEHFPFGIGLHQESVLSLLLFFFDDEWIDMT